MKNSKALILAAVSLSFIMCSSAQPVVISQADNQKEIRVKNGDSIELTLDTQPSTGYSWQIASLSCVEKSGDSRIDSGGNIRVMGRVETEHMFFKAVKTGSGFIDLKYIRVWETDAVPARSYRVSVIVEDK